MNTEMNTLRRDHIKLVVIFVASILFLYACNNDRSYLEKAIRHENVLQCVLIYAKDSAIILVNNISIAFLNELEEFSGVTNPEKYLLESIMSGTAIRVSSKFYKDNSDWQIIADSEMDSIYSKEGVKGLVKRYFKKDEDSYTLWNSEEKFPVHGSIPYPAYGEDHNAEYMAYLLSRHHIYLYHGWVCEGGISYIDISRSVSDMKQLDGL